MASQRLLYGADVDNAPFITYGPDANEEGWNNLQGLHCRCCYMYVCSSTFLGADKKAVKLGKGWVPVPLRAWFWIPLVGFMIILSIGLEFALYYSKQRDGESSGI